MAAEWRLIWMLPDGRISLEIQKCRKRIFAGERPNIHAIILQSNIRHQSVHFAVIRERYARLARKERQNEAMKAACNNKVQRLQQHKKILNRRDVAKREARARCRFETGIDTGSEIIE